MKILITGCRGQLGTELQHQLSAEGCAIGPLPERLRKATVIPVDVDELDITDREAVERFVREHAIGAVVNCAAYTDVERAEEDAERAELLNATAAGCTLAPIPQGQEVVIVIGEALDKAAIEANLKG